jgi:uncharacterized protein
MIPPVPDPPASGSPATAAASGAARSCAGCTLCCKLTSISVLDKPAGVWCRHCAPASGCTIYEARPQVCRDFACGWLQDSAVTQHWFPARSRMILVREKQPRRLSVHADPDRPDLWRQEPYLSDLMAWAQDLVPQGIQLLVQAPPRLFGILPGGPVDLGQSAAGGEVVLESRPDASGQPRWRYRRLPLG